MEGSGRGGSEDWESARLARQSGSLHPPLRNPAPQDEGDTPLSRRKAADWPAEGMSSNQDPRPGGQLGPRVPKRPWRDSMPGPGLGLSVMQRRWLLWLPGHPEPQEAPAGWLDLESSICPRSQLPPAESRCQGHNLKTTDARASAWVSISQPAKRHFSTNTLKDSVCGGDAPPHPPGKLSVPPFLSSP